MRLPQIGLLTCAWGRLDLLRIVLTHARPFAEYRVCVQSPEDPGIPDIQEVDKLGWDGPLIPNRHVGAKWNAGLQWLRGENVDAVMLLGTDDLLSATLVDSAAHAINDGADWFGLRDAYLYSVAAGEMRYWPGYPPGDPRFGETIGTARTFSRRYLDAHGWKLWPDDATSGLDYASDPARSRFDGTTASVKDVGAMVDVKAYPGVDLGSFYSFAGAKTVDPAPVWSQFPEETVGKVLSLREKLNGRPVPKSAEPPLIAGCLIARDCEATIGRALDSLRGVADELVVVVDSRTTDRTAEIAMGFGAKVVTREFDDFAGQRNASLDLATAPWAFILDADEWLERPGNIREAVANAPSDVDAIAVTFSFADGSPNFAETAGLMERVLRRERVRYRFPIHHQTTGVRGRMIAEGLILERYDAEQIERSARRTIEGLEAALKDCAPENRELRAHAYHYLARTYAMIGMWESAIVFAEKCANEFPEDAGNWLTLIDATERRDGIMATGGPISRAVEVHPTFRPLRWWAARLQVMIMLQLGGMPDLYAMVPSRLPRQMQHLDAALPFFGFTKGIEQPAAPVAGSRVEK